LGRFFAFAAQEIGENHRWSGSTMGKCFIDVERIALLVLKCFNTLGLSVLQIGCSSFDRTLVGTCAWPWQHIQGKL
jgi:hypothetical protein